MAWKPQSTIVVEHEAGTAQVGSWISPELGVSSPVSSLVGYLKAGEDAEAVLRSASALPTGFPIELNGYGTLDILQRATVKEEELASGADSLPYLEFMRQHPALTSFPSEVLWMTPEKGLRALAGGVADALPNTGIGLSAKDAEKVGERLTVIAAERRLTHGFWNHIAKERFDGEPLSKFFLAYQIEMASRARARAIAAATPLLDPQSRGCVNLGHRYNLALAGLLADISGARQPVQFYSIDLNSTMFKSRGAPLLDQALANAATALETQDLFGGLHFTVRNLDELGQDRERARAVLSFVERMGRLCQSLHLPLWWGRAGMCGLAGLDHGVHVASATPNLSHVEFYPKGGGGGSISYGRVLNHETGHLHSVEQFDALRRDPSRTLPDLAGVASTPAGIEGYDRIYRPGTRKPRTKKAIAAAMAANGGVLPPSSYPQGEYRLWSKPRNLAGLVALSADWRHHVSAGDNLPGRSYLQRMDEYRNWSV